MSSRLAALALGLGLTLLAADVSALQQPDGTTIPVGNSLQTLFDGRSDAVSALNNAAITPETFTPTCSLTFEVLQRNAGFSNSFGWYNVTGAKPADSELYEFLACTDGVGTVRVLDIKNDTNYAGGDIGFYQATGNCATTTNYDNVFFSEKDFNPDSSQQNPFIHLLIYDSVAVPNAFYFAWEDLLSGGDNDFDDLTTFVTGITCSGGGGACQTGQLGICADGTVQCQSGQLACVQLNQPATETCDGLDNDCNGDTDEGDLCPANEVCDKGSCVPKCTGTEYPCPAGKVCNPVGVCVDAQCLMVSCPSGTKCVAGQCVAPCDGVICPYGQVCLVGVCLDPCTKITCDATQVCELGTCVEKCQCLGCDAGSSCQTSGLCLLDACTGVTCPAGSHCIADGSCADNCDGAQCPAGEICLDGGCVSDPAGSSSSGAGGGQVFVGGGTPSASSGEGGAGSGAGGAPTQLVNTTTDSDCGCHLVGSRSRGRIAAWLGWLGLLLLARRRRR
jgi:hypothetical protein